MKKENFSRCLEIVKRDDAEEFNDFIKSILDAGDKYSENDSKILLCYATEFGAKNVVEDILMYDSISPDVYDNYPLRVAIVKGYKEIVDYLNTDGKISISELDNKEILNFSKKVNEVKENYKKQLLDLKKSTNELLTQAINIV